jgi:hypothetical protein
MPTTDTPQAAVPERRSRESLLLAAVTTQPGVKILGPRLVTANGPALAETVYAAFRQLQNCGIVPVKYLVSATGDCDANTFHGILAACSTVDDGLGSVAQFGITGDRVTIFGVGGNPRVAVFEGSAPEGQP